MTVKTKSPAAVPTQPPGPRPAFPGQHLISMMRSPLPLLMESARYGDVSHVGDRIGGQVGTYLLNHPDFIRDALVTNNRMFIKSSVLQRMRKGFLGDGLLTSEGELHLRQRRLIQPAFHRQRINAYAEIMTDYALQTSARWQDGARQENGATLDIHTEMMRLTMLVVGQALFGANLEGEAAELGAAITTLLHGSRRLLLPFWEQIQHLPIPSFREAEQAGQVVDRTIRRMIETRRNELNTPGGAAQRNDLLEMLLLARDTEGDGEGMSDQLVRDEVLTLFLAGHETTANALTWTWYLLSQNPQAEARLHAELEQALGGRTPTIEDVDRLPYTRRVLTESMRLYPPAWIVGRQAEEDYPVGGYVLPAGSNILMSQWVMHRDPRYYPDPERFDPDRWTPERSAGLPKFAYFPFGGGPRLCIGEPFAWMEGILILATLAQRWQLRLDPAQVVEPLPQITLRPKYGMHMRLVKRQP